MRGLCLLSLAALAAVLPAAACAPRRDAQGANAPAATAAPSAHRHDPAPKNPDLGTVIERYYQFIEGSHWPFAYAMLSQRYRAVLSQDQFERRYDALAAADVTAQQLDGSTVVARIDAKDRADRTRMLRIRETVKLVWDGEDWRIDSIARR